MASDHGGTQNPIGALSHMYLHEPFLFTVGHRAVDVLHQDRECRYRDSLFPRLPNIKTDMGDLRISISTPRDRQCAQPRATEEQRVSHRDARRGRGRMSELIFEANIARRIDSPVTSFQEVIDVDSG